ncbi:hypothetical protein M758_2G147200 [Ceratodon purpureus]|nr:hypothetical protein M758_2G147200 [Ceratodon purpureus]
MCRTCTQRTAKTAGSKRKVETGSRDTLILFEEWFITTIYTFSAYLKQDQRGTSFFRPPLDIMCGWKLEHVPSHVPPHVPHRFDVIKFTQCTWVEAPETQSVNECYLTLVLFEPTSGTGTTEELTQKLSAEEKTKSSPPQLLSASLNSSSTSPCSCS